MPTKRVNKLRAKILNLTPAQEKLLAHLDEQGVQYEITTRNGRAHFRIDNSWNWDQNDYDESDYEIGAFDLYVDGWGD